FQRFDARWRTLPPTIPCPLAWTRRQAMNAIRAAIMSADGGSAPAGPLQGLRVIDAGTMIAGPLSATLLADLGADVIKIEQPGLGDPMRHWTPVKGERSLWGKVIGRNKRLITLNLSNSEGQELFRRLVPTVDVIVENYRPGTFE